MDAAKKERERHAGELLIEWYNQRHGTSFQLHRQPDDAADNYYRGGTKELKIEVTEAFYDDKDDAMYKRLKKNEWKGENFTQYLVNQINSLIADKCINDYGKNCLLAVYILADMTNADDMEPLLKDITIPTTHRFEGIYLCGEFPPPPDDIYISGVLKGARPPLERRVWPLWVNEPIG